MKNQKNCDFIEKLLSGCNSTTLKNRVYSILRRNERIEWRLISCHEEGDIGWAEFISPIEGLDRAYHLTYELAPLRERKHLTICNAEINQTL